MKRLILLGVILTLTGHIQAQNLEEIIVKNIDARGGLERLKKLNTVIIEAASNTNGMEIPMKMSIAQDRGFRMDMTLMGMENFMLLNPKEGYVFFPIQGQKAPEPLPSDKVIGMQEAYDLQGEFINTEKKGLKLELQGIEDVDGTPCYKIKCIRPSKAEKRIYVDKDSYQIIKEVTKVNIDGKDEEQTSEFSNFKVVDGYVVAHEFGGPMGKMNVKKYTINSEIPENLFQLKK